MREKLTVRTEERGDGTTVYYLSGRFYGTAEAYAFQDQARAAIAAGARRTVIDLSGVDRIDSSGIGILVGLMFSGHRSGGGIVLARIPAEIKDLLGMLMLLERMEHADSLEEAVAKLDAMSAS
jgi:anti-sigma B factor antagonist